MPSAAPERGALLPGRRHQQTLTSQAGLASCAEQGQAMGTDGCFEGPIRDSWVLPKALSASLTSNENGTTLKRTNRKS